MMHKNHSELIVHTHANGCTAKDPLKVKLVIKESSRTQECKSEGEFTYLKRVMVCCLYSSGELTRVP